MLQFMKATAVYKLKALIYFCLDKMNSFDKRKFKENDSKTTTPTSEDYSFKKNDELNSFCNKLSLFNANEDFKMTENNNSSTNNISDEDSVVEGLLSLYLIFELDRMYLRLKFNSLK